MLALRLKTKQAVERSKTMLKLKHAEVLPFLLALCFLPLSFQGSASGAEKKTQLVGKIDYRAAALASVGLYLDREKFPARISRVKMGTPAFYGGLQVGDLVSNIVFEGKEIQLPLIRNGRKFFLKLAQPIPKVTDSQKEAFAEPAQKVSEPISYSLKDCDLVFMVDISGSMNDFENTVNVSRWEWCQKQIESFSSINSEKMKNGFSICLFNDGHKFEPNCTLRNLQRCFHSVQPEGNTNLGAPMQIILDKYLDGSRVRPLVIVVMTDGLPNRGKNVEQLIIGTTNRIHNNKEIRITFLEIGDEFESNTLLTTLDEKLTTMGAKHDIVQVFPFGILRELGLRKVLESTIR